MLTCLQKGHRREQPIIFHWPFKTTRQRESNYRRGSNLVNKDRISDLFFFYFADSFISRGSRGQEDRCPNCWQRQTLFQHFCLKRRHFIKDSAVFFSLQFISYIKRKKQKKNGSPSFPHLILPRPSRTVPQRLYFVFYLCNSTLKSLWITSL